MGGAIRILAGTVTSILTLCGRAVEAAPSISKASKMISYSGGLIKAGEEAATITKVASEGGKLAKVFEVETVAAKTSGGILDFFKSGYGKTFVSKVAKPAMNIANGYFLFDFIKDRFWGKHGDTEKDKKENKNGAIVGVPIPPGGAGGSGDSGGGDTSVAGAGGLAALERSETLLREIRGDFSDDCALGKVAFNHNREHALDLLHEMLTERRLHSNLPLDKSLQDKVSNLDTREVLYLVSILNSAAKRICDLNESNPGVCNAFRISSSLSHVYNALPTTALEIALARRDQNNHDLEAMAFSYVGTVNKFQDELVSSAVDDFFNASTTKMDLFDLTSRATEYAHVSSALVNHNKEFMSFAITGCSTDVRLTTIEGFLDRFSVDKDGEDDESHIVNFIYNSQRPSKGFHHYYRSVQRHEDNNYTFYHNILNA